MDKYVIMNLSLGKSVLVDEENAELLLAHKWYPYRRFHLWYVRSLKRIHSRNGRVEQIDLHRLIIMAPSGMMVDHINGDGLDNRKANLRVCTNSQNQQNRLRLSTNTSGYRGVTFSKASKKWQAGIKLNSKSYHLGLFISAEDAARAYDNAARKLFGEFARSNFPA